MNQELKIEYFHTEAEYVSAARLYLFSSPGILVRMAVFFALLMLGVATLTILVGDFPLWASILLAVLVEASLLYNILVRAPVQYFRGDGKFRDKFEVTFSDEGIAVKTNQIDSKLAWSLYTKVVEGADQYLLIYGKELRMITIIPKKAFANQIQEDAFRNLVKRHISEYSRFGRIGSRSKSETEYQPTSLNPPDWR